MATLTTVTPASAEPLTPGDFVTKMHLRVDSNDDDGLIEEYIRAAREYVEHQTHLRLMRQTVRVTLQDFWPGGANGILLPVAPIQSVAAVLYMDTKGVWQTMPPDAYHLVQSQKPNHLRPAYGQSWPVVKSAQDAVQIDLVVGFGDNRFEVPASLLQAMRLLVAHWYGPTGREGATPKSMADIPFGVGALIGPHRLWI